MNKVYQLEFLGSQAFLVSLLFRKKPPVFQLNSDNHDLSALTQATEMFNKRGEEVVSVVVAGTSGDGIRSRFLIITKPAGTAPIR